MQDVVDSIRKLLRLASESPSAPERKLAAERAEALMRKHRVHVTAEDGHHRAVVGDVNGHFWKSQVLASLARLHRCKLVKRADGSGDSVVVGARSDVEVVISDFMRIHVEIVARYIAAWDASEKYERSREGVESVQDAMSLMFGQEDFSEIAPDRVFEIIAERAAAAGKKRRELIEQRRREMAAAEELWRAEFFNSLAEAVTARLKPAVKPRPRPKYDPAPFYLALKTSLSDRERERSRLDEVIKAMGDSSYASRLMRTAAERGRVAASGLAWCWSAARQLPAASESFPPPLPPPPPPKPTRYNQIDID